MIISRRENGQSSIQLGFIPRGKEVKLIEIPTRVYALQLKKRLFTEVLSRDKEFRKSVFRKS